MHTDFLVIGSGLAGLNYSLNVARKFPEKKITIVTKNEIAESNTKYAQGGIAVVQNNTDSYQKHIQDTIQAGDGYCDEKIVEMVIRQAPDCLKELTDLGIEFDRNGSGSFDLGKEGGHSENRVVHHKDITGFAIEKGLINAVKKAENINLLEHHFAIDLLITENQGDTSNCHGAVVINLNNNQIIEVSASITLIASGGIGQAYQHTTNPFVATGDGIAMAFRANAKISDMEFVQFHPTALYQPNTFPSFLISEAVRGFGAHLKNENGGAFMEHYDVRKDLASRDVVTRAIISEMKLHNHNCVYLDCRHLQPNEFRQHFPNIVDKCTSSGIFPEKDLIPVIPVQHYLCGGIETNEWGETSIKGLLACGEAARTGLHGANRLASNSLLEACVFSKRCSEISAKMIQATTESGPKYQQKMYAFTNSEKLELVSNWRKNIQEIMWKYAGIIRSDIGLMEGLHHLHSIESEIQHHFSEYDIAYSLCELRNILTVSKLIIRHSMKQTENRGGFYNTDLDETEINQKSIFHGDFSI